MPFSGNQQTRHSVYGGAQRPYGSFEGKTEEVLGDLESFGMRSAAYTRGLVAATPERGLVARRPERGLVAETPERGLVARRPQTGKRLDVEILFLLLAWEEGEIVQTEEGDLVQVN